MTTGKKQKLSPAQLAMLSSLAAGRAWDCHLSGRSAYGAAGATLHVLKRRGYMEGGKITDAGREALAGATRAAG
jgi:hypothetical protein